MDRVPGWDFGVVSLDGADMLHGRERRVCAGRCEVAVKGGLTQSQFLVPFSLACCTPEAIKLFLAFPDAKGGHSRGGKKISLSSSRFLAENSCNQKTDCYKKNKFNYVPTYMSPIKLQDSKKWLEQEAFLPFRQINNKFVKIWQTKGFGLRMVKWWRSNKVFNTAFLALNSYLWSF